ncbi:DMT family transporter [Haloarculaceae archaeon H-GB2-1]|nr:DMT family transporter [Haloarculaceae archaeon H-GB1-1]MEA5386504.1 DMT family transporter [Haloarculaceae archaeon H-GB11]MEA5408017.1 DMT family transporter [Haloarculaceae archaeon H-GB2-1]
MAETEPEGTSTPTTPRLRRSYRNLALFVALAALWGGGFPAVEVGLDDFPPILYAALRFDVASVLMLAYAVSKFDYWRPRAVRDWAAVFAGGLFTLAGYSVFLNVGQRLVPSTMAAILSGLIPLLTVGFAKLLLPEEGFDTYELFGVCLGFVGLVVITRPDISTLLSGHTTGKTILVLSSISFALGGVLTQWANASMPIASRTAWAMVVGALVNHGASFASPSESLGEVGVSLDGAVALLYLGVFVSAVGYVLYFDLLERLGSVELNLVTYGVSMFGIVFSWALFGDRLSALTIAGLVLIFVGFLVVKREEFYEEYEQFVSASRSGS